MKHAVTRGLRRRIFQPFWERLHHFSRIGQNYWSSTVQESGELYALDFARNRLATSGSSIVVDVGANVGQFALAAADKLRPAAVHSFEPSTAAFQRLESAIRAAGLEDIVLPHRYALSDREAEAILYSSREGATIASLHNLRHPPRPFSPEFSESVRTTTLDAFCMSHRIHEIAYLKIDVEGHELSVLNGAQRMLAEDRIRFIQFEFGEANIDSRTFMRDFFELLGPKFQLYRIVSDGLRRIPAYHSNLEVFATINYLAIRTS